MILSLLTSSNKLRTLPHSSAYGPAQPGIPFAQATYSAHHSFLCKWKQSHLTKSAVQRSLPISKMTNHCNASLTSATPYFQVIYSSHQYSSLPKPFAGWFGKTAPPSALYLEPKQCCGGTSNRTLCFIFPWHRQWWAWAFIWGLLKNHGMTSGSKGPQRSSRFTSLAIGRGTFH